MNLFEALTTSFGTAGTGGFAIWNDGFVSVSPYNQWVVTIFMLLFGVNFGLFPDSHRKAAGCAEV